MQEIDRIVVIHDFSTPRGGASTLAVEAVRQFRAHDIPVTMFAGDSPNEDLADLGAELVNLSTETLLELPTVSALRKGYHNRDTADRLNAWIDANDTPGTIYHMNNWSQILSPAIFVPLRRVAARTLITCHDFFNVCPNGSFLHFGRSQPCHLKPLSAACYLSQCDRRSPLHKAWRLARQHHLNGLADFDRAPFAYSFIHERMLERFKQAGFKSDETSIIRNPVRPWCSDRVRAEDNKGFLFVGRVGREKGADLALEATRAAGQELTLVGTGELVESGARDFPHAEFAGWQQAGEIARFARQARAVIVPSRCTEPFGLVILEAAMSGLPVIVSDQAYLAPELDAAGIGKSFELADPGGLQRAIEHLAHDDAAVKRMSQAAFETASKLCHTPQSWAQAHIEQFQLRLNKLTV